jgi:hypothetical protein
MATNLSAYTFSRREIARHRCLDCGVDVIEIGDYCLLTNKVWEGALGLRGDDNLCIACIEKRLGRKLSLMQHDFAGLPWVDGFPPSDTMLARYGHKTKGPEKARKKPKKARKRPTRR